MEGCILQDAPGRDVSPAEGIGSDSDVEHSGETAAGGISASECLDGGAVSVEVETRTVTLEA
jgi:hypothetical protein